MAGRIKGVTVEIGGDVTKLDAALKNVNDKIKATQSQLKDVERLLKLDPTNTTLLAQKQQLLAQAIKDTSSKLETLREAEKQAQEQFQRGEITQAQYQGLQREIIATEQKLKGLQDQAKQTADDGLEELEEQAQDTGDELEKTGDKTSGLADKLENGLAVAAEIGAAALAAATAAVAAFAKAAVGVGMEFDTSMSQVAATMGTTTDEIQELRDFALQMGSTTAFSASQAADALNYMALAGYDAEKSMAMLPSVLNLAAAGGIELAAASDMITDAQSALGLTLEETSSMVDQMAKAASKSNTSVSQLGEAILTVGGTASYMAGGTEELNTVLGVLADNGIKGSEAGTHLRNMLLSMASPTKDAKKLLSKLNVQVFDAEGNMRSFADIFPELNAAMSGMTDEEKLDAFSTLFNSRDIASATALLNTTAKRWDELGDAISDSADAAQQMADTQLDNLAGDITMFKSALEGAQIAVSDQLTPALRDLAQFGTDAISMLSSAFQEGGLSGAMEALGTLLSEGLNMVIAQLPGMIEAGMQLLGAIGQGLMDNMPVIIDAARSVVSMLATSLIENLPALASAAIEIIGMLVASIGENLPLILEAGGQMLRELATGIETGLPEMVSRLPQIIEGFLGFITENLPVILDIGVDVINSLVNGIISAIPILIAALPEIIMSFVNFITENLPLIFEAGGEIVTNLIGGILGMVPGLDTAWDSILSSFQGFMDWLQATFGPVWDAIIGAAQTIFQTFQEALSVAWDAITSVFQVFTDFLQEVFGATWGDVFTGAQGVMETVGGVIQTMVGVLTNIFSGLVSFLADVFLSRFKATLDNLVSYFTAIKDNIVQVVNGIKTIFQGVIDFVTGVFTGDWKKAWQGVQDIFKGVFDALVGIVKTPINGIIKLLNTVIDAINTFTKGINKALSALSFVGINVSIPQIDHIAYLWKGGILESGNAIVGEKGPELLSLMNGKARVTPLTDNGGGQSTAASASDAAGYNQTLNFYTAAMTPSEVARQTRNATRQMLAKARG